MLGQNANELEAVKASTAAEVEAKSKELETFRQKGADLVRQLDVANAMLAAEREAKARALDERGESLQKELEDAKRRVSAAR